MTEAGDRDELADLWAACEASDFPPECEGLEVEGLTCDEAWSSVTGCIIEYLETRPSLPSWRTATLGLAYGNLAAMLSHLGDAGSEYFGRLHRISHLALLEINVSGEY